MFGLYLKSNKFHPWTLIAGSRQRQSKINHNISRLAKSNSLAFSVSSKLCLYLQPKIPESIKQSTGWDNSYLLDLADFCVWCFWVGLPGTSICHLITSVLWPGLVWTGVTAPVSFHECGLLLQAGYSASPLNTAQMFSISHYSEILATGTVIKSLTQGKNASHIPSNQRELVKSSWQGNTIHPCVPPHDHGHVCCAVVHIPVVL